MAAVAVISMLSAQELQAQQGGPYALLKSSYENMQKGNWQAAYDNVQNAIRIFDARSEVLGFGDTFGQFWYVKALCELNLKENKKAIESAQTGMTKYKGPKNKWKGASYMLMAQAYIDLKDYPSAIKTLDAFSKYRIANADTLPPEDKEMNMGMVYALIAQCHFLSEKPNFEEGIKNVKLIADNRYKGRKIPDDPIIRAFLAMVNASITADRPEVALDFLKDGRSVVALEPWRSATYAQTFLGLSKAMREKSDSVAKPELAQNYLKLSQEMLTLVADQEDVDQSVKDTITRMGAFKAIDDSTVTYNRAALEEVQKTHAKAVEQTRMPYGALVLIMSSADYINGTAYRQARAAYEFMVSNYTDMDPVTRENNMFQIVAMSTAIGDMEGSNRAIANFRKEFPKSKHLESVDTLTVSNLFEARRYAEALEEANKIMKTDPKDKNLRQAALSVQGFSAYQLKKYVEAYAALQKYVAEFPESANLNSAMYQLASSLKHQKRYEGAIRAYNRYIEKFPNDKYVEYALYDRAECGILRSDDSGNELALQDFDRLSKDFPDSPLIPAALVGKGRLLQDKIKDNAKALQAFKDAITVSKKADNRRFLGEALYKAILLMEKSKEKEARQEAVALYDDYWKEKLYEEKTISSNDRLVLPVATLELMTEFNRREEGMSRLVESIVTVAKQYPETSSEIVEKALNSYTKEYLKDKGDKLNLEEIKQHYYNFPGVDSSDSNLVAILRIALVGIYEAELAKIDSNDTGAIAAQNAQIHIIFKDIQKSLEIPVMTPFALRKLGDYLVEKTDHPEEAIPYYDELIKRNDPKYLNDAKLGLALAYNRSTDQARKTKSTAMLTELVNSLNGKNDGASMSTREKALYYLAQFSYNNGEYDQAAVQAVAYLKENLNGKYKAEMTLLLGQSYEKSGNIDSAITAYGQASMTYRGRVSISAPAMESYMRLLYQRNRPKPDVDKPSDRYLAYTMGLNYAKFVESNYEKMTLGDRVATRDVMKLVEQYGNDPAIKEEDQAAKAREEARKASMGKKR